MVMLLHQLASQYLHLRLMLVIAARTKTMAMMDTGRMAVLSEAHLLLWVSLLWH